MTIHWEDGFCIRVSTQGKTVTLSANPEGLQSLANILAAMAQEPVGSHIHLDENNALEEASAEFIIDRI